MAQLLTATEDFSAVAWANDSVTVTANTGAAPAFAGSRAGLADTVADNSAVVQAAIGSNSTAIASGGTYFASLYVRKDAVTSRFTNLNVTWFSGGSLTRGIQFNTSTGAIGLASDMTGPDDSGVVDVDSSWWRLWLKSVDPTGVSTEIKWTWYPARASTITGAGDSTVTGNSIIWGANLASGLALPAYIPEPLYAFPRRILFRR